MCNEDGIDTIYNKDFSSSFSASTKLTRDVKASFCLKVNGVYSTIWLMKSVSNDSIIKLPANPLELNQ